MGREGSHRASGGWLEHRLAGVANCELRHVRAPDSCSLHALADLVVDSAKVFPDYVRTMALCLDGDDGQKFVERHLYVDTVARLTSARNPEQPLQAHYVIDAKHSGHAQVVRERGAQLLVTFRPDCFRARGRKAPRLALSKEAVGWGTDFHVCCVEVPTPPDVVAARVDAHGKVEG